MRPKRTLPPVLVLVLVLPAGCSWIKSKQPDRRPVTPAGGVVVYKNRPVANASVTFQSQDGVIAATGKTDDAGHFALTTYDAKDGAPPGKYTVVVATNATQEVETGVLAPEPEGGFKSPIPAKYADPNTSGLVIEVTEGGKNEFTLRLD